MPKRIQLRRTKGWRMPAGAVKVDRATVFGNPFKVSADLNAAGTVAAFRVWLATTGSTFAPSRRQVLLDRLHTLRGRDLACWCPEGAPCHADVLLELAKGGTDD